MKKTPSQTDVSRVVRFGDWEYNDAGIEKRMPWLSTDSHWAILTTSIEPTYREWGTSSRDRAPPPTTSSAPGFTDRPCIPAESCTGSERTRCELYSTAHHRAPSASPLRKSQSRAVNRTVQRGQHGQVRVCNVYIPHVVPIYNHLQRLVIACNL